MPNSDRSGLHRLLTPRSIAFIGGSVAEMAIKRCLELGFNGEIWPVNPRLDSVAGYPAFPSVDALPGPPDAAYIAIRNRLTIETVRSLSAMGAGGCVCYAAGFAEVGGEGEKLQEQLVEATGDMPLIGPNCFGYVNYVDKCSLWPYLFGGEPSDRGVALISQSGNIAMNLTMNDRSLRMTYVIGAGNQATLGTGDYINALLDDDRVSAIGMYIEGIDDVNHFALAAKRAIAKRVPIVVLKVGRTEAAAQQSSSHTNSLTGSDALHDVFFERLGIVRVDSLNQLLETLKILDAAVPLTGLKIVTMSCSGGEAAVIADVAPEYGLETPPFSDAQTRDLTSQFPDYVTVSNPFDYNTSIWGDPEALRRCFTSAMTGTHDAAFLIYDHPTVVGSGKEVDEWVQALDAFIDAHKATGMPAFVLSTISELLPREIRDRAAAGGVIPLQGLDDGLAAYAAAATYYSRCEQLATNLTLPRVANNLNVGVSGPRVLDENESKLALSEYGLTIPSGGVCSVDDAATFAERIGFPVVVKAHGRDFLHKSDLGAVALNLRSADEVRAAVASIQVSCASHELIVTSFLVERMIETAVAELIVGVKRDEQFGPALVIGAGGILVELLSDTLSLLLPTDREAVQNAIGSLAIATLMNGYRGNPPGDFAALVDAVLAIAAFTEANWSSLLELDVNPLMVLPIGEGVVAADALISLVE